MPAENNYIRKRSPWISSSIRGLIFSFPIVGFIYGFLKCEDCGNGIFSVIGRMFIGCVEAVLTTITLGAPWKNEGGGSSTNLRLYVVIAFLVLTVLFYLREKNKVKPI